MVLTNSVVLLLFAAKQRSLVKRWSKVEKKEEKTDLLRAVVDPEDEQQCDEVENSKQVLAKADVLSMAGDVVESCEDVDKARRIPATARSK